MVVEQAVKEWDETPGALVLVHAVTEVFVVIHTHELRLCLAADRIAIGLSGATMLLPRVNRWVPGERLERKEDLE